MSDIELLAQRATEGDRGALEGVVLGVQDDVYRLALRMLGHPDDAKDATQEILIKITTNLGSFQGKSRLRTWVWRLASNHLLNWKRGRRELFSYEAMAELIAQGAATPEPEAKEALLLSEEVKLGCTQGMLLALDRDHRLAYILTDLLELPGEDAAAALDIEPATLRKRVSRARERLGEFMAKHCGLVDERNGCRCTKMVAVTTRMGFLDPQNLLWKVHPARPRKQARTALSAEVRELDALILRAHEVQRSHPEYTAPGEVAARIREILSSSPSEVLKVR